MPRHAASAPLDAALAGPQHHYDTMSGALSIQPRPPSLDFTPDPLAVFPGALHPDGAGPRTSQESSSSQPGWGYPGSADTQHARQSQPQSFGPAFPGPSPFLPSASAAAAQANRPWQANPLATPDVTPLHHEPSPGNQQQHLPWGPAGPPAGGLHAAAPTMSVPRSYATAHNMAQPLSDHSEAGLLSNSAYPMDGEDEQQRVHGRAERLGGKNDRYLSRTHQSPFPVGQGRALQDKPMPAIMRSLGIGVVDPVSARFSHIQVILLALQLCLRCKNLCDSGVNPIDMQSNAWDALLHQLFGSTENHMTMYGIANPVATASSGRLNGAPTSTPAHSDARGSRV